MVGFWPYLLAFKAAVPEILLSKVLDFFGLEVFYTWVHLKRLTLSPTTETVVRDRLCCPRQTLSSTTVEKD